MIPFNLYDFFVNPLRKVITRNGRSASIEMIDQRDSFPVKAVIDSKQHLTFDRNGHLFDFKDSQLDLFFATEVKEKWVNLYKSDGEYHFGPTMFDSKEEAENIDEKHPTYVATIRINWEEPLNIVTNG